MCKRLLQSSTTSHPHAVQDRACDGAALDVRLAKFCAIIYVVTNPLSEKIPTPKDQLDAQDRLIIIRVKIERAKKHLRDLAAEILTLTHTTIVHRDPKTGVPPNPITFMWNPDFKTVPTLSFDVVAISGDIIHNLRSALDHLAHQLVFVGSPHLTTSTISRNIGFPIAESMAKYEAIKVGKVEGMRPEAKKAIDRLKPYKGGNDPLWRVHELDNIDKHRALFTVAHDFLFTSDWFGGAYLMKAENPTFPGVEPNVEQDIQVEIEKAISKSGVAGPDTLLPSLHDLVDVVENLVLGFKPLLE